jgi:hypothetical protein
VQLLERLVAVRARTRILWSGRPTRLIRFRLDVFNSAKDVSTVFRGTFNPMTGRRIADDILQVTYFTGARREKTLSGVNECCERGLRNKDFESKIFHRTLLEFYSLIVLFFLSSR